MAPRWAGLWVQSSGTTDLPKVVRSHGSSSGASLEAADDSLPTAGSRWIMGNEVSSSVLLDYDTKKNAATH